MIQVHNVQILKVGSLIGNAQATKVKVIKVYTNVHYSCWLSTRDKSSFTCRPGTSEKVVSHAGYAQVIKVVSHADYRHK